MQHTLLCVLYSIRYVSCAACVLWVCVCSCIHVCMCVYVCMCRGAQLKTRAVCFRFNDRLQQLLESFIASYTLHAHGPHIPELNVRCSATVHAAHLQEVLNNLWQLNNADLMIRNSSKKGNIKFNFHDCVTHCVCLTEINLCVQHERKSFHTRSEYA